MKTRIVCLAPGRVAPGMTLAAAVISHDGHILIAAETRLDSEKLDRLIRRGVEAISVWVADTRDDATIALALSAAQSRLAHIFRGDGNPAREALHAAVLDFRLEQNR